MTEKDDEPFDLAIRIAKAAFAKAIDMSACATLLAARNTEEISTCLKKERAHWAAGIIQKALFHRLLVSTMVAYDPPRPGDFHLRVAFEGPLRDTTVLDTLAAKGNPSRLKAAIADFAAASKAPELVRLRHIRNKQAAHESELDPSIPRPSINDLLSLSARTASISEALAQGTGIVTLTLESQLVVHQESAAAFWAPWAN